MLCSSELEGKVVFFLPLIVLVLLLIFSWRFLRQSWNDIKWLFSTKDPEDAKNPQGNESWRSLPINEKAPTHHKSSFNPSWSLDLLRKLEWKRFEEVVSDFYSQSGYRTQTTRMGSDGGVDVLLFESGEQTPAAVVQCKSWHGKVGVKPVRELLGVMTAKGVSRGVFVTTSGYTREAIDFARETPLELVDGAIFLAMLQKLPDETKNMVLKRAIAGDYWTPTCPNCNVKMLSRESKKGANAGTFFWGCRNYPRCKQTFKQT